VAFAIIAVAILATIPIVASFDRSFSGNAKRSRHPTIAVPLTEVDRHAGPIS